MIGGVGGCLMFCAVLINKGNFVIVASFPLQKRLGTYDAGLYPHCRLAPSLPIREGGSEVRHCFYAVRDKAKDYLSLEV